MADRARYCAACGAAYGDATQWPRTCGACGHVVYGNPLPVAVLLLPVDDGILTIRRAIPPVGALALPGGFIDHGEEWRHAAARELFEEAQIRIDPAWIRERRVLSAPDGTLLVFGEAPRLRAADLPAFAPSAEASERVILRAPEPLAFPLHTQVLAEWFGAARPKG